MTGLKSPVKAAAVMKMARSTGKTRSVQTLWEYSNIDGPYMINKNGDMFMMKDHKYLGKFYVMQDPPVLLHSASSGV